MTIVGLAVLRTWLFVLNAIESTGDNADLLPMAYKHPVFIENVNLFNSIIG